VKPKLSIHFFIV